MILISFYSDESYGSFYQKRKKKYIKNQTLPSYLHNYVSVCMKLYPRKLAPLPFEVNLHFYVISTTWTEIIS